MSGRNYIHARASWHWIFNLTFVGHLRNYYIVSFIFFDLYLFSSFPCSSYVTGAQIRLYHSPITYFFFPQCVHPPCIGNRASAYFIRGGAHAAGEADDRSRPAGFTFAPLRSQATSSNFWWKLAAPIIATSHEVLIST